MKTKAKIMVAISRENTGSQDHRRDPRRKGGHGYAERPWQENQKGPTYYYCGKEGHFKRNRRQLLKDQKNPSGNTDGRPRGLGVSGTLPPGK